MRSRDIHPPIKIQRRRLFTSKLQLSEKIRLMETHRVEFEKELDLRLRNHHIKRNITNATARHVDEDILSEKPELRNEIDKRITFSDKYFFEPWMALRTTQGIKKIFPERSFRKWKTKEGVFEFK